jgi:lipoprotein NlpI
MGIAAPADDRAVFRRGVSISAGPCGVKLFGLAVFQRAAESARFLIVICGRVGGRPDARRRRRGLALTGKQGGCAMRWLAAGVSIAGAVSVAAAAVAAVPNWSEACRSDDYDRAIAACTSILLNKHQKPAARAETFAHRGYAQQRVGDHDAAIDDLSDAIRLAPDYAIAYASRGYSYENVGEPQNAIADYSRAIELDPTDAVTFADRGRVYHDTGNRTAAMADYSKAIELDPAYAPAHNGRGVLHARGGEYDRAIADYSEAIRLRSDLAFYYGDRGAAYEAKGDYDRALADYDQEIRLNPKSGFAHIGRGSALSHKGDFPGAIAAFDVGIQLDPTNGFNYLSRSVAYLYSGNPEKALADLNQAREVDPAYAYIPLWMDIIAQRNKTPSRLASEAARLDMSEWPAPILKLFLGQLTQEAVLAAAADPDPLTRKGLVCEANFYGGELALVRGDRESARRLLEVAARDCPFDYIESAAAKAELRALGAVP